ncbi:MAG: bi-domain-containing oxidoreductase [Pseudomonadota bacterium]|jgi:polar amino acid transport system substrate-binding protein
MKQVIRRVIDRKGRIKVEEVPVPVTGSRDVLIDTRCSVISSGTEMSTLNKTFPELVKQTLQDPWMRQAVKNVMASGGILGTMDRVHDELIAYRLVGYSGAGIVLETGPEVRDISVGDRVAFSGQGHSEIVRASRNQTVKIPEGVGMEEAAFSTIGAIALQGVRRARIELGHTVAVIGLGLMGQIAFQLAQASGANCIGIEPSSDRRDLALELGIAHVVDPGQEDPIDRVNSMTGGAGADRILICASGKNKTIANQALKMCRPQGRVAVLGIVPMDLERMPFFRKELDFVFSRAYGPGPMDPEWESGRIEYPANYIRWDAKRNMAAFMDQIASGRVKVTPLISGTHPVEKAQEAYDAIYGGSSLASLLSYEPSGTEPVSTYRVPVGKPVSAGAVKNVVRVGFIGCGNFTRSVLLPEMKKVKGAKIHALAASTGINTKPMAEKYGARYVTSNVEEVLGDSDIDAVVISTRHHLHAPLAIRALEAGKHVMVEKPMAMDIAHALKMAELAAANDLHLIVGHNRRYAPLTRRLLSSTILSSPVMAQYNVNIRPLPAGHWTLDEQEGGGRLLGESDHFFDVLNLFTSSAPRSVSAVSLVQGDQKVHESCDFSVQIQYENGSIGTLLYTDLSHPKFPRERLEVFTGGAYMRMDDYGRAEVHSGKGWRKKGSVDMGHGLELKNFVDVILGSAEPMGNAQDGLNATLVAQAALRSIQSASLVNIDELLSGPGEHLGEPAPGESGGQVPQTDELDLLGEIADSTVWDLTD